MSTRFNFTGKLDAVTDSNAKGYFLRTGKTGKGASYKSINLPVIQEKNNRAYVELFGMVQDTIKTMDSNNNKIEVDWDDRFDESVLKDIPNYKKIVVKLGDDRREFLSSYDAVEYIADNIDEFKDKVVTVTGMCQKNVYKGKISDKYQISSIRTVDEDDAVKRLSVTLDLFYNKESFDTADWTKEKKLYIDGWVEDYMSDVKEVRYVPQQIVFDCTKVDFDNEKHRKLVEYRLKILGCELDANNKIVIKLKGKNMFKMGMICSYINGSEEKEFDESMLTALQKEAIELGINKLEDFKPAGQIYGERVVIYKLRDFNMRAEGEYAEGYVDTEITKAEFEEKVYEVAAPLTEQDVFKEHAPDELTEDEEEDLFG